MRTYWRIEERGEDAYVCKNCWRHQDAPYDRCPDCGYKEEEKRMDKFCKDCVHNEVCMYDAICITGHCNDKETLDDLRPKGEWVVDDWSKIIECNKCRGQAPIDITSGEQYRSNFCPICGADMRKEDKK